MFPTLLAGETNSSSHDFREKYISDIAKVLNDKEFIDRNSSDNGFTRKRKLSFVNMVILLTQGFTRSIQRELNSFFQKIKGTDFSGQEVTKSAFTHARAKLSPRAFIELNRIAVNSFYKQAPYLKWRGFRLLSIDGSSIMLPNHPTITDFFGTNKFGPGDKGKDKSVAKISMLYDVLNLTTLDAQISGFNTSERHFPSLHLAQATPGSDLLIMDRAYPSLSFLFELQQQKINYCIRMKEGWWLEIRKMRLNNETDKIITMKLKKRDNHLLNQYKTKDDGITFRVIVFTLPDGSTQVFCTSVLDNNVIAYEDFSDLYHKRWNIEEGYKLYKCRIELEAFSGKTAKAILQDFYAKVFMMTTTAIITFPIEEKVKKDPEIKRRNHTYKVNRTNALSMVKQIAWRIFTGELVIQALRAFDDFLRKTIEIVRPNRSVPRRVNQRKPPSMAYKQL